MHEDERVLNEQVSLCARKTPDAVWLERMNDWDPVARLGDTLLQNAQVTDQPVRSTRLIPAESVREIGQWLADTLHKPFAGSGPGGPEGHGALSEDDVARILGFSVKQFPLPYEEWRMSTEIYLVVGRICYVLMNQQFVRYRALSSDDLGQLFSQRVAPFGTFDEGTTGAILIVSSVPGRLAAFGGLRGFRRALLEAGVAQEWLKTRLSRSNSVWWDWTTEFYDDALCSVLSLDGVERAPMCLAYQRDSGMCKTEGTVNA
ncbi:MULTISPECIES: nitroreductase family protein [Micrococcaceae]|uniref:hypothetical protein n=1 Tax=unclassified Kocuria TaxID=2649579 RepID=UPI001011142B|nr:MULTISPECIES: hypothetical protein [unclassified Kocuria]